MILVAMLVFLSSLVLLMIICLPVHLIFRDCNDLGITVLNDFVAILILINLNECVLLGNTYHILYLLEFIQVLMNVRVFIIKVFFNIITSLECCYQILILFEIVLLFMRGLVITFSGTLAITLR
jgi:hypothetical protein